jgi:ribosomal 50S subunit-recycling heat shock protein
MSATAPGGGSAPTTLRGQRIANRVVRTMLATPGVSQGIGRALVTVYVVGRKTGRRYSVPVAYVRDGGDVVIGTPFRWNRNLRTGDTIDIRLRGHRIPVRVTAYTSREDVARHYAMLCRHNKQFAKLNKIAYNADGEPSQADLDAAWSVGARAFRLTPVH